MGGGGGHHTQAQHRALTPTRWRTHPTKAPHQGAQPRRTGTTCAARTVSNASCATDSSLRVCASSLWASSSLRDRSSREGEGGANCLSIACTERARAHTHEPHEHTMLKTCKSHKEHRTRSGNRVEYVLAQNTTTGHFRNPGPTLVRATPLSSLAPPPLPRPLPTHTTPPHNTASATQRRYHSRGTVEIPTTTAAGGGKRTQAPPPTHPSPPRGGGGGYVPRRPHLGLPLLDAGVSVLVCRRQLGPQRVALRPHGGQRDVGGAVLLRRQPQLPGLLLLLCGQVCGCEQRGG